MRFSAGRDRERLSEAADSGEISRKAERGKTLLRKCECGGSSKESKLRDQGVTRKRNLRKLRT